MLLPVTPSLPFKLGEKTEDPLAMYLSDLFTIGANLAGIPGLAVPMGLEPGGCPWPSSCWTADPSRCCCAPPVRWRSTGKPSACSER